MSRELFILDVTQVNPARSASAEEFLRWATRQFREEHPGPSSVETETTASKMQGGGAHGPSPISMLAAWQAVGSTGSDERHAYTMYGCRDGWAGGWRSMLELYDGVPDSLFLSSIDQLRFSATTIPLAAAVGCPTLAELASGKRAYPYAVLEFSTTHPGAERDYLELVGEQRAPVMQEYGHELIGLFEVCLSDSEVLVVWGTERSDFASRQNAQLSGADPRWASVRSAERALLAKGWTEQLVAACPGPPLSRPQSPLPG